jgi:hypothetical protein
MLFVLDCGLPVFCAEPPAGKVIWWGQPITRNEKFRDQTNGVLERDELIASNVVAIAGYQAHGLALNSDGSVIGFGERFGGIEVPDNVTNISGIGMSWGLNWAQRRDGTLVIWGARAQGEIIVSNVADVVLSELGGLLVLKKNKLLLEYKEPNSTFDPVTGALIRGLGSPKLQPVLAGNGEILEGIIAIAGGENSPLILNDRGVVSELHNDTFVAGAKQVQPVVIGGEILGNVMAIANGGLHHLALKNDGTVIAWGPSYYGETNVPDGLSNVTAIAAAEHLSMALKKDGTVVAWGGNYAGQTSVPAGLSNVVKIAAAGWFSTALTTGAVPSSVFITPHGQLEEMAREADLIFKGEAISTERFTNAGFKVSGPSGMEVARTKFRIISVLQGDVKTNYIHFQHYSGWTPGGHSWSGAHEPAYYQFQPGQCYLVYAANLSRSNLYSYYQAPLHTSDAPDEFRELADYPKHDDDGVARTLDARPIGKDIPVKDAHWMEFNLLLQSAVGTNRLYAIQHLDWFSQVCGDSWNHTDDFKRPKVLKAASPFIAETNEQVSIAAIRCFQVGSDCATQLVSYIPNLLAVANDPALSVNRRVKAIAAFAGTKFRVITNSLPRWLADPSEQVRAQAVSLLTDFPGEFSEQALRDRAADASPKVRAGVADAIGNGKILLLLPTLEALLKDPVGLTNPVPPVPVANVRASERVWREENNDVHMAAGYALLKFDTDQVTNILVANLNDPEFRVKYLCKLAKSNAAPWVSDITEALEARQSENEKMAKYEGRSLSSYMYLNGTYGDCWEILYKYLDGLGAGEFADNKQGKYIDALEHTCDPNGNYRPLMLYELYRKKGLSQRATVFRTDFEKKLATYRIKEAFDQVDSRLTNAVGK